MTRQVEPFSEEVHCMTVLFQEYNKRNDLDTVAAVEQELSEIVQTCVTKEADVHQIIKNLSKQVQDLEMVAAYPHQEGLHAERVGALQRQIDSTRRMIDEMDMDSRTAEQQCEEVDARLRALKTDALKAAAESKAIADALGSQMAMYKHITRATWVPGKQTIAGSICDIRTGNFQVFEHPEDMDRFELINKLWELI